MVDLYGPDNDHNHNEENIPKLSFLVGSSLFFLDQHSFPRIRTTTSFLRVNEPSDFMVPLGF